MRQNQLFIESLSDALHEAVREMGGHKTVGNLLWPEKPIREAGNQLGNCLNPDHSQKLSLEQVDFIFSEARREGIHVIAQYIAKHYGYKLIPVHKEDEKAELQREFIKAQKELTILAGKIGEIA